MPPRKGKDDLSEKSKTTGPAMATRSRTVNQRVEAPSSPPDGKRKRTGDGKRKKPQSKVGPERLDNQGGCVDTTEPQQLDLKELSKRGTWGILQNVKERFPGIFLRGEKFTIGREKCDFNIKDLPENEVLCTIKMSAEQEYSILSHSVSRLLKLNDLILTPEEEKPLVHGDVICWSLKTACFHVFLETARANSQNAQNNCETRLEDPNGVAVEKPEPISENVYFMQTLLGPSPPDLASKEDSGTADKINDHQSSTDAMEVDVADRVSEILASISRQTKQPRKNNSANSGGSSPEKEDTHISLMSICDSIKERIVSPESIQFSFNSFPYYISSRLKERLMYTATVYFEHQSFASYINNIETLNRRILLTGPPGSNRCMEAVVAALAKDKGADLLTFDWDLVTGDGEEDNEDDGLDEITDDLDIFEEFEKRFATTGEGLNLGFGGVRKCGKRGRGKQAARPSDPEKLMVSKKAHIVNPPPKAFRKGDRVVYTGSSSKGKPGVTITTPSGPAKKMQKEVDIMGEVRMGPRVGCAGRVISVDPEDPHRIGVCFDSAMFGGWDLRGTCESGRGFLCDSSELKHEAIGKRGGFENNIIDLFFEVAQQVSAKKPLVVHIKDAELSVVSKMERSSRFKRRLEGLTGPVVVIGTTIREQKKETGPSGLFSKFGSHPSAMLEFGFFEKLGKADDRSANKAESTKSMKNLAKLFPNHLCIVAPSEETDLKEWRRAIELDTELSNEEHNRRLMAAAIQKCNAHCPDLDKIAIKDAEMPIEDIEKLIGLAVGHRLSQDGRPDFYDTKLVIKRDDIERASILFKGFQEEPTTNKGDLHDVVTDNEFEKRLLVDVVPPGEVGIGFDDIGALENVKKTLQEIVMLPLQRPELFARGQLLKPTKGVLLFGPPGTGKTMLAKAVAAESGANFLNMSVSSIASKWFGEGEKYVRALFSLAHKISPCVIFVDEVDSLLGRRDKTNEHEAMRKIKNEFMANWDGLRTNEHDRVLVMAATNRPMDLDEAVIRRMPRRLLVDLPDADNRVKILTTILRRETVDDDFSYEELAAVTDGYSGSDLKNLCLEAALHPVRDYLKHEKEEGVSVAESDKADEVPRSDQKLVLSLKSKKTNTPGHVAKKAKTVQLRPIGMQDMLAAAKQIASSVSNDAISMTEIRNWNQLYGEGGNREKAQLSYFM